MSPCINYVPLMAGLMSPLLLSLLYMIEAKTRKGIQMLKIKLIRKSITSMVFPFKQSHARDFKTIHPSVQPIYMKIQSKGYNHELGTYLERSVAYYYSLGNIMY